MLVIGLALIALFILLILGPMFLFSTYNILGTYNPISQSSVIFQLDIRSKHGDQLSTYKLFQTSSLSELKANITDSEFQTMNFTKQSDTLTYNPG